MLTASVLVSGTELSLPEKVRHYIDVFVAGMVQAAEPEAGLEGLGQREVRVESPLLTPCGP